jgi:hypothetical protein
MALELGKRTQETLKKTNNEQPTLEEQITLKNQTTVEEQTSTNTVKTVVGTIIGLTAMTIYRFFKPSDDVPVDESDGGDGPSGGGGGGGHGGGPDGDNDDDSGDGSSGNDGESGGNGGGDNDDGVSNKEIAFLDIDFSSDDDDSDYDPKDNSNSNKYNYDTTTLEYTGYSVTAAVAAAGIFAIYSGNFDIVESTLSQASGIIPDALGIYDIL